MDNHKEQSDGIKNSKEEIKSEDTPYIFEREEVLSLLSELLQMLRKKVRNGRVKQPKTDKIKIEWLRLLVYSCNIYSSILKDKEIERLNERIGALEERLNQK